MTTGILEGTRSVKARRGRTADASSDRREGRPEAPAPTRAPSNLSHRWPWGRRIKEQELMSLCQHLGALTGSGVSLAQCLRTFADEAPKGPLRDVLQEIITDIEDGRKLSDALARHPDDFSPHFRASIWAGETSGNMAETLERLAKYLENKLETRQRVRNAFAYPVVLLLVIAGVVSFLMLYVVPVFSSVYAKMGVKLPAVTQALVDISHVLVTKPYLLAFPIILFGGLGYWTRRTDAGRLWLDCWKVRVPIVGPLFKQMVLYRFMRSFGEIMGAGVMVLEALDLAGRVTGNEAFIAALEPVRQDVQRGMGLTEPLRRTGWFPASLLQVISSGEQSGRVPALLGRAADILQRDIDLTLKRVVGRIEPLLTVLMALIVGVILLAVYLPMFDVMQHVGQ